MIQITKRVDFSASHRLYNPDWDFDKNEEVFDKCNNPNGHGHNYILEVTIKGNPDPETGYVYDLKKLKLLLKEKVVSKLDHKHLNKDVDFLQGIIPTVENIAVMIWRILEPEITNGKLYKIKLNETPDSWVEYYGEDIEINRFG